MARAGSSPAIGTLKWLFHRENPATDLKFGWRTVTQKNAGKRNLFAKFVASASRARDSCDEKRNGKRVYYGMPDTLRAWPRVAPQYQSQQRRPPPQCYLNKQVVCAS
jgi:hypothetical protein